MTVRVGMVGLGYWGPNLVRNLYQADGCDLAICCDLDPDRRSRVQRQYPAVEVTDSYQDMLSRDIDAVVVATPAKTHFALVRDALENGKHVMVEKPLAFTSPECEELIQIADDRNLVLMVGHTFLYNPAVWKVKELLTKEYFGDLFYLYSHRVNLGRVQTDINALWSIAPHDVSIALHLMNEEPLSVSARGASYLNGGIEDVVFLTLEFGGGVIANVHVSWIDPSKVRQVTVVGSKRMIVYDDVADEGKVKVYDKGVSKIRDDNGPYYGEFHYRLHAGDIYAPHIPLSEPLANECAHFIDCVANGRQPITDGRSGLAVVRVLEAAQRSLEMKGMAAPVLPEENGYHSAAPAAATSQLVWP